MLSKVHKNIRALMACVGAMACLLSALAIAMPMAVADATAPTVTVPSKEDMLSFVTANNNRLVGITPTVSGGNPTGANVNDVNSGVEVLPRLTDGSIENNNRVCLNPTGDYADVTYALTKRTTISDIIVACREYKSTCYLDRYEVYVSDALATLYSQSSLVYKKESGTNDGGGQRIQFAEGSQPVGMYVGFRINKAVSDSQTQVGELGVYGTDAPALEKIVKQTTTHSAYFQKFLTDNLNNNLLKGLVPTTAEEGTSYVNPTTDFVWSNWTDGNYDTNIIYFPSGLGTDVLRYTFTLPHYTKISALMLVCRQNKPQDFALKYQVYASDELAALYDENNCIFDNAGGAYAEGGQLIELSGSAQQTAVYVGFRLVDAPNKFHISELGVYGTEAAAPEVVVKQTTTHSEYFQKFLTDNKSNNRLNTLTPAVEEEETDVDVYGAADAVWDNLTDADYLSQASQVYLAASDKGNKVIRLTYELKRHTKISVVVLACRENHKDLHVARYQIYAGNDASSLYDEENLLFDNGDGAYTEGGQLAELSGNAQRTALYVGFRLIEPLVHKGSFHLGELGVYGEDVQLVTRGGQLRDDKVTDNYALRFGFDLYDSTVRYESEDPLETGNYKRAESAQITVGGTSYDIVDMGAVVTNTKDLTAETAEELLKEHLESGTADTDNIVKVEAKNLYEINEETGAVTYTAVIINIPAGYEDRMLYAIPYVQYGDGEILYGSLAQEKVIDHLG